MPTFSFEALDAAGATTTGSIEADSRIEAVRQLKGQGIVPLQVEEMAAASAAGRSASLPAARPVAAGVSRTRKRRRRGRITRRDVMVFTHQLASLFNAGLPLLKALHLLKQQTENERFQEIIARIADDVEGGDSFSDALGRHPRVFNRLYVSMVAVAETGGVLDKVLAQLADFIERGEEFRGNIITAVIYPVFLLILATVAVTFLMVFIVPAITGILEESGQELPAPTKLLQAISYFLRAWWWAIFAAIAGGIWAFRKYRATPEGRFKIDAFLMRIPLLGRIIEKAAIGRFARTLATLSESGVPILQTLQLMPETVGNAVIAREVEAVAEDVRKGEGLARPLARSDVFPEMVSHLVSIGEETGQLENMLYKVADAYDFEVTNAVKRFTSILEPLLIFIMAGVVGFIVISMLLPILSITQGVGM